MAEPLEIQREALPPAQRLQQEWRALEGESDRGFFLSWAWIGTWLATLPPTIKLFLLRAKREGATLGLAIAVACDAPGGRLWRSRGLHLHATGDRDLDAIFIEHNGFLCKASIEGAALAALAAWFVDAEPARDALHLPGIAKAVGGGSLLGEEIERPGFALDLTRVAAAGGDVAAALGGTAGQRLRRALRRYQQRGPLSLREATSVGQALDFFEALKRFHVASWQRRGRKHAFASPHFEHFHRALIEREFTAGTIQLLRVTAGEDAIGHLYNFRRGGVVYAYQSGFDDRARGFSPGVVSHGLAAAHNAERGERLYDFLAGANRLKESFATRRYSLVWQILRRPRLDHRLRAAARHAIGGG